jgi:hypothetical protein
VTPALDLRAFIAAHNNIPAPVAVMMLILWKDHIQQRHYGHLLSTGKLCQSQRYCDGCNGALASEARHLFRRDGKGTGGIALKSYFICPSCEERWEKLGDAGVPNCLPDWLNWANWAPEPIDLTRCGDCCDEFTLDNPAKSIPTTLKGSIFLLCGHCTKDWKDHPEQQTPGLAFTLVPVAGSSAVVS